MYESFVSREFSDKTLAIIEKADAICKEYKAQGYTLTLRQLYYQFVARALIANKQTEYDRLGAIISNARLAGLIDWSAIEDRTRNLETLPSWDSPRNILNACANQFRFDLWEDQPTRVECWIEKEALVGVIENVCNEFRVPYFACRGYASQSELWRAGKRFIRYRDANQSVVVLHLGDHDPSGLDMTRDNLDRLAMFTRAEEEEVEPPEVIRLALNMDQVRKYNPPPNPAKLTDSRAESYIAEHGNMSWELDALNPTVIGNLIRRNIEQHIDQEKWDESVQREQNARDRLSEIATSWKDE